MDGRPEPFSSHLSVGESAVVHLRALQPNVLQFGASEQQSAGRQRVGQCEARCCGGSKVISLDRQTILIKEASVEHLSCQAP